MNYSKMIITAIAGLVLAWGGAAHAKCENCGTVTDLKTVKQKGEGSGLGAVAGGVLGGVLGHQVGGGRGKDLATVAGAAGGAYAGHQTEKKLKEKTVHQVVVKLEGGDTRTFSFGTASAFKIGDKVKVVDGKLVRD
jgi:outer membrane lipoprotein SlyB